ncbi:hypothetical protein PFISCL1PPCAC_28488, partial [Pristionchus fissidentatus]
TWLSDHQLKTRDYERIRVIFKQIVEAVAYIHEQLAIHRDLKPANILFDDKDQVRVCDLGIVSEFYYGDGLELTGTRTATGTPLYCSPEQARGERYNSKVDVFSLGLICIDLYVYMTKDDQKAVFNNYREEDDKKNPGIEILSLIDDTRIRDLITNMTKFEYSERPSCRKVLDEYIQ